MTVSAPDQKSAENDAVVEQAAEWLVRLSSEEASAEERSAFEAWKRTDPRHAMAAEQLSGLLEGVQALRHSGVDTRPLHATLDAVVRRPGRCSQRRRFAGTAALLLVLTVPGWLALQKYSPGYLLADLSTAAGQPKSLQLADNTRISLKGASAVKLHYDEKKRTVDLLRGEILLDVARDASRPFVVETRHGSIRALGTRFAVRSDEDATVLTLLESSVSVSTATASGAQNYAGLVVSAGERLRIGASVLGGVERVDIRSVEDAWKFNQLLVRDAPLPEVLDELARQRAGLIRYDRASLDGIKVSAVLPLGDTDQALRLLSASHHLRVSHYTRWLVSVEAPARP